MYMSDAAGVTVSQSTNKGYIMSGNNRASLDCAIGGNGSVSRIFGILQRPADAGGGDEFTGFGILSSELGRLTGNQL